MAEQYDPYSQPFQLGGLEALTQPDPMRLARELLAQGMPVEDVALQTGVGVDDLMMGQIDNRLQTKRNIDDMTGIYSMSPQPDFSNNSSIQNIDMSSGIASTLDPNMMQMSNNMMPQQDIANDQAFSNQMTEGLIDTMDFLGLTKDEDTADDVDGVVAAQINASAQKVQSAQASGDPNAVAEATGNAKNLTLLNASILDYLGKTPEAREEAMNIYREAAETMLGGEDLDKFIRRPDKALPYMAAGMALTQAGTEGEDWITALSNAFSKYAITKKQGEMEFQDKYLQYKMQRQATIDDFASKLALQDLSASYDATIGKDRSPHVVNGRLMHISPREIQTYEKNGASVVPYNSDFHSDVSEYTVSNTETGYLGLEHLSDFQVSQLTNFPNIELSEGNLLKNKEQYSVIYPEGLTNDNLPPILSNGIGGRRHYLQLSDAEMADMNSQLSGTGIELTNKPRNLKKVIRTDVDGLDRLMYIPENQVRPTDKPYESGVYFESDGVVFATGNTGGTQQKRYNNKIKKEWQANLASAAKVYNITDQIQNEVKNNNAVLPSIVRGTVTGLRTFLDEGSAIFNLIGQLTGNTTDLSFAETADGSLSRTGVIEFSNGEDTYEAMYSRFVNSRKIQDLTGVSTANREYNALTFNLALAVASAFGLGDGRALSDKDLVFALEMVGYGSSNLTQLQAAHNRLRRQTYAPIAADFARYGTDGGLTEETLKTISDQYNLPIDALGGELTHQDYVKMLSGESEENPTPQTDAPNVLQNNSYQGFIKGLRGIDDTSKLISTIQDKLKEMRGESTSKQAEMRQAMSIYLADLQVNNPDLHEILIKQFSPSATTD
tara:strand:- start:3639 stop:6143 length:2505 start_codon:yes stop_codon:yes gene_type:complete